MLIPTATKALLKAVPSTQTLRKAAEILATHGEGDLQSVGAYLQGLADQIDREDRVTEMVQQTGASRSMVRTILSRFGQ